MSYNLDKYGGIMCVCVWVGASVYVYVYVCVFYYVLKEKIFIVIKEEEESGSLKFFITLQSDAYNVKKGFLKHQ